MSRRISSLKVTYEELYGIGLSNHTTLRAHSALRLPDENAVVPDNSSLQLVEDVSGAMDGLTASCGCTNIEPYSYNQPGADNPSSSCSYHPQPLHTGCNTDIPHQLQDALHHRINIELEKFKAALQQSVSEQFGMGLDCPSQHCSCSSTSLACEEYASDVDVPDHQRGACINDHQPEMDCCYCQEHDSPQDSGIGSHCDNNQVQLENQLDKTVLQLLTLSCQITATLRRSEYSTTHCCPTEVSSLN